jgi:hypothetical protein
METILWKIIEMSDRVVRADFRLLDQSQFRLNENHFKLQEALNGRSIFAMCLQDLEYLDEVKKLQYQNENQQIDLVMTLDCNL